MPTLDPPRRSYRPPGPVHPHGVTQAQRREYDRESPSRRGYGRRWERLRAMILNQEPLCRECGEPATDVDHIVPRALGGTDAAENLQPLCHACHSRKTGRERATQRPG